MQDTPDIAVEEPQEPAPPAVPVLAGRAAEVFRGLWVSLFYSGRPASSTVMVCSARSGEGTSTVACGLALAGSESAALARVALVDFNLRRPALHEMLGRQPGPGISDVLMGQVSLEAAAQRVNDGLDLYAVGGAAEAILDLFRGQGPAKALRALAERYNYVLVDVAPVNQYPEAQVLAAAAGSVVLVAHADRTPLEAVVQARRSIEAGGGKLAGTVLNLRTYPIPKFLYRRV